MSRSLRIQYEGACYHVISRGNHREVVFSENSDCELFLEKFVEFFDIDSREQPLLPKINAVSPRGDIESCNILL